MSASPYGRGGGDATDSPADPPVEVGFDVDTLVALRSTVAAHGDRLGLGEARVNDLVLVAHELAANAVRHGGGSGRLRLWGADGSVFCEVADEGTGFEYTTRSAPSAGPAPGSTGGRGLWIVAEIVDRIEVTSGPGGTVATVRLRVR